MELFIAIMITILMVLIIIKDFKKYIKMLKDINSQKDQLDPFYFTIPLIIAMVVSFINWQDNNFKFNNITDWIYVITCLLSILYFCFGLYINLKIKKSKN